MQVSTSIQLISDDESAQGFYLYLDRPVWFINHFQSIFDDHRALTKGVLFLYRADNNQKNHKVQGCIYVELTPKHRSYNEQIPIFGWLQADSEAIALELLKCVEEYAADRGFHTLRGPINTPALYGGWGAKYQGLDIPLSVDFSSNQKELSEWIDRAGFVVESEYVDVQSTSQYLVDNPTMDENIEKIQIPVKDVLNNPEIMHQLFTSGFG